MLFLSSDERSAWQEMAREVVAKAMEPDRFQMQMRRVLLPVFRLYAGVALFKEGMADLGRDWIRAGTLEESEGIMFDVFLASFLERQGGRLIMPAVCFEDPAPYIHFTGVPTVKDARHNFALHLEHSLPDFHKPVRIVDIGCGDGGMLLLLLTHLRQAGKMGDISSLVLVDPSEGMLHSARQTLGPAFRGVRIESVNRRIQEVAASLDGRFDVAICSLSYHHMPIEEKRVHLEQLKPLIDHFVLFELDANNDTPEVGSPELALSAYQAYGRMIDRVFAHDAPLEIACRCVDNFLMTELVSILTQPRGVRSDYHMLQHQWLDLLDETLSPELTPWSLSTCYGDEYFNLFMVHYGR